MTLNIKPNGVFMAIAHLVAETEYERGWGSKVEEYRVFQSKEAASKYIEDYDKKYNTQSVVPDWYMTNHYVCTIVIDDAQFALIPENGLVFSRSHKFVYG